jgi:hypothetical protein
MRDQEEENCSEMPFQGPIDLIVPRRAIDSDM